MSLFTTASKRFNYGMACCLLSIIVCSFAIVSLSHSLDMVALIAFMVGLALMVEVDF